jgi:hypothetical protein
MTKNMDPSEAIVYSCVAPDGTIRWALHPMTKAPNFKRCCDGDPDFRFRVLFYHPYSYAESITYSSSMRASCRGSGGYYNFQSIISGYPRHVKRRVAKNADLSALCWLWFGGEQHKYFAMFDCHSANIDSCNV